jgi:hypothetical protein
VGTTLTTDAAAGARDEHSLWRHRETPAHARQRKDVRFRGRLRSPFSDGVDVPRIDFPREPKNRFTQAIESATNAKQIHSGQCTF